MEKSEKIKQQLIEFNEEVGWGTIDAETASKLASLLIEESVELWREIANENTAGINKYDVSLEVADVYIFLQKICIALGLDMLKAVEDKMLINRARFLNQDYVNKAITPVPKAGRFYKISNTYNPMKSKSGTALISGQILGVKTSAGENQQVIIIGEDQVKANYMKQIIAVITTHEKQVPIWIAADNELSPEQINDELRYVELMFDVDLVR